MLLIAVSYRRCRRNSRVKLDNVIKSANHLLTYYYLETIYTINTVNRFVKAKIKFRTPSAKNYAQAFK